MIEMLKLEDYFLKKIDEENNNFRNQRIYYNGDKKHITSKYFKLKQKKF